VTEGPARVRDLVNDGAVFDTGADGTFALTREGGHGTHRIVHAGGDATGAELSRALVARLEAVRQDPGIEVMEQALVVDVLTGAGGSRDATGWDATGWDATRRPRAAGGRPPRVDGAPGPVCGV